MAGQSNAAFVGSSIAKHKDVESVELLSDRTLCIHRKEGAASFVVGVVRSRRVTAEDIAPLISVPQIKMVINIPKDAWWTGAAISATTVAGAAFGGIADLFRAAREDDPSEFVNPEFRFVERGLQQHSNVVTLLREHDRLYNIFRHRHGPLRTVLLNEYDLTADHIREAREKYGQFTEILATDPNCRFTDDATEAAEALGASIYMWGEFLSRLNKP